MRSSNSSPLSEIGLWNTCGTCVPRIPLAYHGTVHRNTEFTRLKRRVSTALCSPVVLTVHVHKGTAERHTRTHISLFVMPDLPSTPTKKVALPRRSKLKLSPFVVDHLEHHHGGHTEEEDESEQDQRTIPSEPIPVAKILVHKLLHCRACV